MHVPRRSLRALGAALATGALLAAASTAHADVPGPRTLNPQPEPPGVLHDARAADGTAVDRYHLESAWPAKIEIGGLKAGASEVLYSRTRAVPLAVVDPARLRDLARVSIRFALVELARRVGMGTFIS
jgi:hypothetical protein